MFDAAVFGAMRDGALFVNAGRGATVDQAALLDAVPPDAAPCWTWPTRSRCPRTTRCGRRQACWRSPSHQAGDSAAADARCVALAVEQLRAYAAGRAD